MSSEDITLQRVDHSVSLIQVFERLLESSSLVDCTIAAEGQYLKAHRVILSACSPFFEVLFRQENEKNPIVILKDTKFDDLKAVIEFVYRGQIQIPEFQLNGFINTVESLQIQGICRDGAYKDMERRRNELLLHGNGDSISPAAYPCTSTSSLSAFENATQQFSAFGENESGNIQNRLPPSVSQGESFLSANHSVMKTEIFLPDGESLDEPKDEIYVEETPIWEADEGNRTEQTIANVGNQANANQYANFPLSHEEADAAHAFLMPPVGEPIFGQNTAGQEGYSAERLGLPSVMLNAQLYTCNECHKSFTEKSSLYIHQRSHGEEPPYPCVVCHKSFSQKNKLIRHQRIHTGLRPHSCTECHKSFKLRHHLIRHQLIHTVKRPYSSIECQKLMAQRNLVMKYQRTIPEERSYPCSDCHKTFPDANTLKIHRRIHTGERPYPCGECHKSFTQKSHLTRHQRVHTGQRPFLCTYCHKSFADTSVLLKHKRTHTGERPYVCPVCHKSFIQKVSLNIHLRIHTAERPYTCGECNRSFAERSMLIRHQLVHAGQPHYSCSECQKTYTDKSSLIIHQSTHSDFTQVPSTTNNSNEEGS